MVTALVASVIVAIVLFGISWIPKPVLTELHLGAWGLLYGTVAASLFALIYAGAADRIRHDVAKTVHSAMMGAAGVWLLSAATFIVSLIYIIFAKLPTGNLIGTALGVTLVCSLIAMAQMLGPTRGRGWVGFWTMGLVVVLLSLATILTRQHFIQANQSAWWGIPLGIAGAAIVGGTLAATLCTIRAINDQEVAAFWVMGWGTLLIAAGGVAIVARQIAMNWRILELFGIAGGAFALVGYTVWRTAGRADDDPRGMGIEGATAAAMLLLFVIVASFRLMGAFGTSIAVLAGLCFFLPAMGATATIVEPSKMWRVGVGMQAAIVVAVSFMAVRVFLERYQPDIRRVGLDIHYTFIGMLLGVMLPFIFAEMIERTPVLFERGAWRAVRRGVFIWLLTLIIVLGVSAVWSLKASLGIVTGLAAGMALRFLLASVRESTSDGVTGNPYNFGVMLISIGFADVAAQFATISRTQKIWIVAIAAAVVGLWLVISSFGFRRGARR